MNTQPDPSRKKPSRPGYCYRKAAGPQQPDAHPRREDHPAHVRFRLFGMHWRTLPLYRQAGTPFGNTDAGLLLWVEFGRRTHAN